MEKSFVDKLQNEVYNTQRNRSMMEKSFYNNQKWRRDENGEGGFSLFFYVLEGNGGKQEIGVSKRGTEHMESHRMKCLVCVLMSALSFVENRDM